MHSGLRTAVPVPPRLLHASDGSSHNLLTVGLASNQHTRSCHGVAFAAGDDNTTADNLLALRAFYSRFPDMASRPLFLAGQGYAGGHGGGDGDGGRGKGGREGVLRPAGVSILRSGKLPGFAPATRRAMAIVTIPGTPRPPCNGRAASSHLPAAACAAAPPAGHFIPLMAKRMLDYNNDPQGLPDPFQLKGILLGNPWTEPTLDNAGGDPALSSWQEAVRWPRARSTARPARPVSVAAPSRFWREGGLPDGHPRAIVRNAARAWLRCRRRRAACSGRESRAG